MWGPITSLLACTMCLQTCILFKNVVNMKQIQQLSAWKSESFYFNRYAAHCKPCTEFSVSEDPRKDHSCAHTASHVFLITGLQHNALCFFILSVCLWDSKLFILSFFPFFLTHRQHYVSVLDLNAQLVTTENHKICKAERQTTSGP